MTKHDWSLTLLLHLFLELLPFLQNKIKCVLKLSLLVFPSFVQSTICLHHFQLLNLLPDLLWIFLQNPYLPHLLPFFLVSFEFLFTELFTIGVGRVHHFASFGGLHLVIPPKRLFLFIPFVFNLTQIGSRPYELQPRNDAAGAEETRSLSL